MTGVVELWFELVFELEDEDGVGDAVEARDSLPTRTCNVLLVGDLLVGDLFGVPLVGELGVLELVRVFISFKNMIPRSSSLSNSFINVSYVPLTLQITK